MRRDLSDGIHGIVCESTVQRITCNVMCVECQSDKAVEVVLVRAGFCRTLHTTRVGGQTWLFVTFVFCKEKGR